jgi:hypothetical protein
MFHRGGHRGARRGTEERLQATGYRLQEKMKDKQDKGFFHAEVEEESGGSEGKSFFAKGSKKSLSSVNLLSPSSATSALKIAYPSFLPRFAQGQCGIVGRDNLCYSVVDN